MNPWMIAHESLQTAIGLAKIGAETPNELQRIFEKEYQLLREATPFAWSAGSIAAALTASTSVPGDTLLVLHNLPAQVMWWHFERPLDVQTLSDSNAKARALLLAWGGDQFVVSIWCDEDPTREFQMGFSHAEIALLKRARGFVSTHGITPSQLWTWQRGETLDEMRARCSSEHDRIYGPGGKYEQSRERLSHFQVETATSFLSRFILAGISWMSGKVPILQTTEGLIERHMRKDYERRNAGRSPRSVRVVQLRRTERESRESTSPEEPSRKYDSFQWAVSGHWRNQPCGPGRLDRKLTWIEAFLKGPEGAPMLPPRKTVFEVSR